MTLENTDTSVTSLDIEQNVLVVDTTEFTGPLDLLLDLARQQRVDLAKISILELVDQYLAFVNRARSLRINLAADYLVMASWLALLKSRLLLPREVEDGQESAEDLANALTWRMKRLNAMRKAGQTLLDRDQLGVDFFARGQPESVSVMRQMRNTTSLFDLMKAYLFLSSRDSYQPLTLGPDEVVTISEAMDNIRSRLATAMGWTALDRFLPGRWTGSSNLARSATASTLVASLELARRGNLNIRQLVPGRPVEIRPSDDSTNG